MVDPLEQIRRDVVVCAKRPRLVAYRSRVAREKKREFRDEEYLGTPGAGLR